MTAPRWATRTAVTGLVLWGLIHIAGGLSLLVSDTAEGLETLGPSATETVPNNPGETTGALLQFHSLNVLLAGIAVLALATAWSKQRKPWLLNVAVGIAVAMDIGLIAFLVVPGTLPATEGLFGPLLAIVAAVGAIGVTTNQTQLDSP